MVCSCIASDFHAPSLVRWSAVSISSGCWDNNLLASCKSIDFNCSFRKLLSFIFLFFSEIFSNSNCKERKDSSSFSENFGKFIFSSRLVSSKKLSSSHFSIVAIFALLLVISLDETRTASLNVSKYETYSSSFKRSIRNFLRLVSVAVKNCNDAFVF